MSFIQFWTKYILRKNKPNKNTTEHIPDIHEKARNIVLLVSMGSDVFPFIEKMKTYDTGLYVHCLNVATISAKMAYLLDMKEWFVRQIVKGALLHDYGKTFIDTEILNAPRKLTRSEIELIKMHPTYGLDLLSGFGFSEIVEDIVLHHHEEERGKGYPDGSTSMLFETKLVCFADKYDALVTHRSYNKIFTKEEAIEELLKFKGNFTDGEFIISLIAHVECPDAFEFTPKTGLKRKKASIQAFEPKSGFKMANSTS